MSYLDDEILTRQASGEHVGIAPATVDYGYVSYRRVGRAHDSWYEERRRGACGFTRVPASVVPVDVRRRLRFTATP